MKEEEIFFNLLSHHIMEDKYKRSFTPNKL